MIAFVFGWALKLIFAVITVLYGGLVLTSYAIKGARCPLRFEPEEPVRFIQQILVWSGVKLLDLVVRAGKLIGEQLVEASADLGERFVSKRNAKVQTKLHSYFLVKCQWGDVKPVDHMLAERACGDDIQSHSRLRR